MISARVLAELERAARDAYPREACWLLLGREGEPRSVVEAVELPNVAEAPNRFRVDAAVVRAAEMEADRRQLVLVGVFHSHPDAPPRPSRTDLAFAWPWSVYLIVSVDRHGLGELAAWALRPDRTGFDRLRLRSPFDRPAHPLRHLRARPPSL